MLGTESALLDVLDYLDKFTENKNRFLGVVTKVETNLEFLTKAGEILEIPWIEKYNWARPYINENRRGARPRSFEDILNLGDIIWLKQDTLTQNI